MAPDDAQSRDTGAVADGGPPSNTELVIGLVGALGSDLPAVAQSIRTTLNDVFSYESEVLSVSAMMARFEWSSDLNPAREDERIQANMDAGRDLNTDWFDTWKHHDALARLALLDIAEKRGKLNNERGETDLDRPLDRFAFILRSFKRPDEIDLLRAVYGERFVLFGVYSPRKRRRLALVEKISGGYPSGDEANWHDNDELKIDYLIERDEREGGEAGQNVLDTFHRADFFVDDNKDDRDAQVERSVRALFGDYFLTPTRDEAAIAHASTAARRSAEPGRQVGAAITNAEGDLLAVGCNEVPKAFGGQYWTDDREDAREYKRAEAVEGDRRDTNNVEQEAIADDLLNRLRHKLRPGLQTALESLAGIPSDEQSAEAIAVVRSELQSIADLDERETILRSRLGDITEYGRAVHAEMAAITTAARLGTPLQDATLYSTTFPCHNCARHVIATGIRRLVYIAPYAKSQAHQLHADALEVAPDKDPKDKVVFVPFVGVAPRRYAHLFLGQDRKLPDGTIKVFDPTTAVPRLQDADPHEIGLDQLAYSVRETAVVNATEEFLSTPSPTMPETPLEGPS